ncbi:MerR family transcriptional regulator [Kribbella albertanoniae]|uniref:MerR family transcriptional regulator n=1 Tax=Kribbella albertanoniae TaxID=1266829 RepID=A0A4R4P8Z3_9ACTN|nr:MerR family transcriptional regulator [Kribbella albertanoniae]TDC17393.1 MerR family transcriptional regulator [Kribbella albertanoniae]
MTLNGRYSPGEAADLTGLSLDTLRYYEREALIGPIERLPGGRRVFTEGDIAWIGVVTCLRDAGLGIADVQRFTSLLRTTGDPASRVEFLRERRAALADHMTRMEAAMGVLDDKIKYYGARQAEESATA